MSAPRFEVTVKLDDLFTEDSWGDTVGAILRDEIESALRSQVRKAIKDDPNWAALVRLMKDKAIRVATESLK